MEEVKSLEDELFDIYEKDDTIIHSLIEIYEKGRADAERDFQNSDYWNDYLAKVLADARADAIDEYKIALHNKYKENKDFAYSVWEGNIYKFDAMANLDLEEIDVIAEQLKVRK